MRQGRDDTCALITTGTSAPTKSNTHPDLYELAGGSEGDNQIVGVGVLKRSPYVNEETLPVLRDTYSRCIALPWRVILRGQMRPPVAHAWVSSVTLRGGGRCARRGNGLMLRSIDRAVASEEGDGCAQLEERGARRDHGCYTVP